MSRLRLTFLLVLGLALSGTSFAKDHGDKRHDRDRDHDRDHRVVVRHDHDRRHDIRAHRDGRPPGWDHGKKTGWGDCDVPPGQAKKVGCHPGREHHVRISHRRHDREHHRVIVRRDRDHDHDRDRHGRPATMPVRSTSAPAPRPEPITRNPNVRPGTRAAGEEPRRVPTREVQQ